MIHVQCKGCGTWDVVGPGHPATQFDEEQQQHVLVDRTALNHSHADHCSPNEEGSYPLEFTFMSGVDLTGAV